MDTQDKLDSNEPAKLNQIETQRNNFPEVSLRPVPNAAPLTDEPWQITLANAELV